jgi:hypothetical protein
MLITIQECYRDIGLATALRNVATPMDQFPYIRYCKTLAGEEMFRMYCLAGDPQRKVRSVESTRLISNQVTLDDRRNGPKQAPVMH